MHSSHIVNLHVNVKEIILKWSKHMTGDNMIFIGWLDHLQQHGAPALSCGASRRRERFQVLKPQLHCTTQHVPRIPSSEISHLFYHQQSYGELWNCPTCRQERNNWLQQNNHKVSVRINTKTGQSVFIWLLWHLRYEAYIIKHHFWICPSLTPTPPSPWFGYFKLEKKNPLGRITINMQIQFLAHQTEL